MAEKDDRQSLGGDASPPQNRFLLEHFSGSPDVVPWPGIEPARLTLSNGAIDKIVLWYSRFVDLQCQHPLMDGT